jgi:hypothetical protein
MWKYCYVVCSRATRVCAVELHVNRQAEAPQYQECICNLCIVLGALMETVIWKGSSQARHNYVQQSAARLCSGRSALNCACSETK